MIRWGMFIETIPNRTSPPAILLRESYRDEAGKPCKRTLANLSKLPPPPIFPPWQTTYGYFRLFSSSGALERIQFHLVMEERERLIALSQVMIGRLWKRWVPLHRGSPTRLAASHPQFSAGAGSGVGARRFYAGSSGP